MIVVKEKDDLEKLEEEVRHKRMSLDEAIAAIAKRFGVDPPFGSYQQDWSSERVLAHIWGVCEMDMLMAAKVEDVHKYLVESVEKEEMAPSDALEFYCESVGVSSDVLVEFAREDLGFDPYPYAAEEINAEYVGEDISDILAYLDSRDK